MDTPPNLPPDLCARFLDTTLDLLCVTDVEGHLVELNEALRTLLGCTREELRGRSFTELIHPDDVGETVAAFERMRRGEAVSTLENRVVSADGSARWVQWRAATMVGSLLFGVGRDVTDERRLLDELRTSRARVRAAIEGTHDGFTLLRPERDERGAIVDFIVEDLNDRAREILRQDGVDLVGSRLFERFPHFLEMGFRECWSRLLETREVHEEELEVAPERAWYSQRVVPLDDAIAVFTRDITDLKSAAARIQDREEQLAEAEQLARVASADVEPASLRIVAPERIAAFFDAPKATTWDNVLARLHGEDRERLEAMIRSVSPGATATETSLRCASSAGEPRHLLARVRGPRLERAHDGHLVRLVVQDISEQSRESEAVRQLDEAVVAQQIEETLAVLAGRLAHDFNNILVGVSLNLEVVAAAVADDPVASEAVTDVSLASQKMALLTRQLLDYTSSTRRPEASAVHELGPLVEETVRLVRYLVPPEVGLRVNVVPDCYADVDAGRLRQVVMNLVTNAAQAMDGAGEIGVELSRLTRDGKEWARLSVRDDGAGMSSAVLARIFEPFFTTKPKGRGLGLAASKRVVETAGGHIEVESAPGQGTRATVWLPLTGAPAGKRSAGPRTLAGLRVLVVDDEAFVREAVARSLRHAGADVLKAGDGAEALELARGADTRLDAVLMDWIMPGLAGRPLMEAFREHAPGLPVVVMSGFVPDGDQIDGADGFVAKPFDLTVITNVLTAVVAKRRLRP